MTVCDAHGNSITPEGLAQGTLPDLKLSLTAAFGPKHSAAPCWLVQGQRTAVLQGDTWQWAEGTSSFQLPQSVAIVAPVVDGQTRWGPGTLLLPCT